MQTNLNVHCGHGQTYGLSERTYVMTFLALDDDLVPFHICEAHKWNDIFFGEWLWLEHEL